MSKLFSFFLTFLVLFSLFSFFPVVTNAAFAQKISPSPTPTSAPAVVNSYEIFWPLSAGKTINDPLYFLKEWKEKVRGWFIFGSARKADYHVFLGTKRVLETEKLLKEDKDSFATKTLERGVSEFSQAEVKIEKAKTEGTNLNTVKAQMVNRLSNVELLLKVLAQNESGETQVKLNQTIEIVTKLLTVLQ